MGFCLFDKVVYKATTCFIGGRRSSGYFKLVKLDGTVIHKNAREKDLKLIVRGSTTLVEQRKNNYGKEDAAA